MQFDSLAKAISDKLTLKGLNLGLHEKYINKLYYFKTKLDCKTFNSFSVYLQQKNLKQFEKNSSPMPMLCTILNRKPAQIIEVFRT